MDAAADSVAVEIASWNDANAAFTSAAVPAAPASVDVLCAVTGAAAPSASAPATADAATARPMIRNTFRALVCTRARDQASCGSDVR